MRNAVCGGISGSIAVSKKRMRPISIALGILLLTTLLMTDGCRHAKGTVSAPESDPHGGFYGMDQSITINCSTSGATIHYTTDGSAPTASSPVYYSPITAAGDGTSLEIKAIAMKSGMENSIIFTSTYNIKYPKYPAGTMDIDFLKAAGSGADNCVCAIALQDDGKIIIGGFFESYNGELRGCVARLNANGSLDTNFLSTGDGADNPVLALAVQEDGKILIAGKFDSYNGTDRGYIARLNTDGSLDTGFLGMGNGANGNVYSLAVQDDGKILIGGWFTSYNDTNRMHIARLNADGSLDTGFLAAETGANGDIYSLVIQGDGKSLIGGEFTQYNGTRRDRVARLNLDGSLDTSFLSTGAGADGSVSSLAVQRNGKVLICGEFKTYSGANRERVARLNIDGSLDTGFQVTGEDVNGTICSITLQNDGKIIIGGSFLPYGNGSMWCVERVKTDGSLDTRFRSEANFPDDGGGVYSLAVQADGKILTGGDVIHIIDGTGVGNIARFWN